MTRLALLSGLIPMLLAGLAATPPTVAAGSHSARPVASSCATTPCARQPGDRR